MNKYRFWIDTETTSISPELNQILEYAVIVEGPDGQMLEKLDIKIRLRDFVKPEKEALIVNQIDPYSKDWIYSSISEESAAEKLVSLCEKYTFNNFKPIFVAYNASFDKSHIEHMFNRHGISFFDCFNRVIVDPLKLSKQLVNDNILQTKEKIKKNGEIYRSTKLTDIADALKISVDKPAHRALNDVETLIKVSQKMYHMVLGKQIYDIAIQPSLYQPNQIIHVFLDSENSGVKKNYLKVIKNDIEQKTLLVFDLNDYEKIGLSPSNIKRLNYASILDEIKEIEKEKISFIEETWISNMSFFKF